jgi:hypothetical protein
MGWFRVFGAAAAGAGAATTAGGGVPFFAFFLDPNTAAFLVDFATEDREKRREIGLDFI